MNLREMVNKYQDSGYNFLDASAKVAQDVMLLKFSNSRYANKLTIKGGVVMHNISNDMRRATRDLDFDFIKYSLDNKSIINFINNLNKENDNVVLSVVGDIKSLHQQDYNGKRVILKMTDSFGYFIETKLDIGVHKNFDLEQERYCFKFETINKSCTLLINSPEQLFVEKLKSLLKFGIRSTRYKDLFDFYYLIYNSYLHEKKVINCFETLIFNDKKMNENNVEDIIIRLENIFNSKMYRKNINNSTLNWLEVNVDDAINVLLNFLNKLVTIIKC